MLIRIVVGIPTSFSASPCFVVDVGIELHSVGFDLVEKLARSVEPLPVEAQDHDLELVAAELLAAAGRVPAFPRGMAGTMSPRGSKARSCP